VLLFLGAFLVGGGVGYPPPPPYLSLPASFMTQKGDMTKVVNHFLQRIKLMMMMAGIRVVVLLDKVGRVCRRRRVRPG
jgi:hypothetical protein